MPTIEQAVAGYIQLRDNKKTMESRHKEELAPVNEKLQAIEAWLHRELNKQGASHIGTPAGTVYLATRVSAKVEDWEAVLNFIQEEDLWPMLERRVNKSAVEEYLESTGEAPPGVSISRETKANVRR